MDVVTKKANTLLKPVFMNGAWHKPLSKRRQKILGLYTSKPHDSTLKPWELKEPKGHKYVLKQNERYG